ncbi:hypothetical protein SAMN02799622_00914 [Methylobacterium sp. UNC378MF]|nr:hypothetical protein SAMN02799622_00914 [Methylobacterium sp. UNC378MF]
MKPAPVSDLLTPPKARVPAKPITAADVRVALRRRFCAPEWALLFEVGDATGARHTRFADAVAMSLWPSRGLELHGMEIKVSRYDWRNERKRPEKAETIAAYCDRWWLVTGPGVVESSDEIPPAWGWIDFDGERLTTVREATRTDAKDCDRRFLAALLRRASKTDDAAVEAAITRRMREKEEAFDERVRRAVEMRVGDRDQVIRDVEAFEAAAGFKISEFRGFNWDAEETGRAVAALKKSGVDKAFHGLQHAAETLRSCAARVEEALAEIGLPPRKPPTESKRTKRGRA